MQWISQILEIKILLIAKKLCLYIFVEVMNLLELHSWSKTHLLHTLDTLQTVNTLHTLQSSSVSDVLEQNQ